MGQPVSDGTFYRLVGGMLERAVVEKEASMGKAVRALIARVLLVLLAVPWVLGLLWIGWWI